MSYVAEVVLAGLDGHLARLVRASIVDGGIVVADRGLGVTGLHVGEEGIGKVKHPLVNRPLGEQASSLLQNGHLAIVGFFGLKWP